MASIADTTRTAAPSQPTTADAIGPLPLTPFEDFLNACDAPSNPMVFRVRMAFKGEVDRPLLSRSFDMAVDRHPLLRSVLETQGRRLRWIPAPVTPTLQWDAPSAHSGHVAPMDLETEAGLRVVANGGEDSLEILLDFHHACCDGQGARQLIADWLQAYDQLSAGEEPQLVELENARLSERGHLKRMANAQPVTVGELLRNFYHTVCGRTARARPRVAVDDASSPRGGTWLSERPLSADNTSTLRAALKDRGISINDLGIATSMAVFARHFAHLPQRHYITVVNPVDLRRPSDRRLPAANRTGLTFLRRRPAETVDFEHLLTTIRQQTDYIKQSYVGADFVHGLAAAAQVPGMVGLVRASRIFQPTMQFTCLGDTTRGKRYGFRIENGDVVAGPNERQMQLQHISGFAPAGPGVPVSVGACETSSRLAITVRGSDRYVTQEQTERFADDFTQCLMDWAQIDGEQQESDG